MKSIFRILLVLTICAAILSACAPAESESISEPTGGVGLANPASVNCEEKGGTLVIQKRGDGGEYGVCVFEDNLQCEEWAMYRGDCPEGGIKITGYNTEVAIYCAISGGVYAITDKSGAEDEQGTCTFKGGKTCDAWEYFNGTCDANQ
jgi:hypothetical protein